ncbi:MAG: translation elongation factor Ts [Candidatus Saccharicenans sp.]|nr:MAG: translation elongation factor Ts [Candidatus Aminicenantes bacterium]HEK85406.1 translation elongation factor Ts [Candidatus Aminicenantes bacterium]
MEITAEMVKELRNRTGIGVMECKEALQEANGDIEKAIEILRKKGHARAQDKASREAADGAIGAYVHATNRLGVLIEVNCETDFVARNEEFKELVKNLAMQVAAANPQYISSEEIPAEVIEREKEIVRAQLQDAKKPPEIIEKIVQGKLNKFYEEVCLLDQPYIKDDKIKVRDLVNSHIAKFGENIKIKRFARFEIGRY